MTKSCSICTTRRGVDGEPHAELFRTYGVRAYPSIAILAPDGELLSMIPFYDITTVRRSDSLDVWRERIQRAAKALSLQRQETRTAEEERAMYLAELLLGRMRLKEARERYGELDGFNEQEVATIESELVYVEIEEIKSSLKWGDRGAAFQKMADAGRLPVGERSFEFWQGIFNDAARKGGEDAIQRMEYAMQGLRRECSGERHGSALKGFERRFQGYKDK